MSMINLVKELTEYTENTNSMIQILNNFPTLLNQEAKDTNNPPKNPFVSKCILFTKYFSQLGPAFNNSKHCKKNTIYITYPQLQKDYVTVT